MIAAAAFLFGDDLCNGKSNCDIFFDRIYRINRMGAAFGRESWNPKHV